MTRFAGLVAAGAMLVAGATSIAPAGPATASQVSSCSTTTGVLVVVDLRPFGGNITRGCDATPASGYGALREAGFTTTDVSTQGGFVCRINGQPSRDPCVRTPPASAYWSYWHADKGQHSWSYSQQGAQASHPGNGSIDAWVFGGGGSPSFTPAQARNGSSSHGVAPTSTSRPPRRTTHQSAASHVVLPPSTAGSTRRTSASTSRSTGSKTATNHPTASHSSATSGPSSSSSSAPLIVDATPASSSKPTGRGSVMPVVLGLALVVLLGAGAGWTVLRRRRMDAGL